MLYLENCLKKVFQSEVRDCERGMGHNRNSIFTLRTRQDYIIKILFLLLLITSPQRNLNKLNTNTKREKNLQLSKIKLKTLYFEV
jgi:hypothetical protein